MKYVTICIVLAIIAAIFITSVFCSPKPKVGSKAPNFTLKDQNNNNVSLSDYAGKCVALMFYPSINTPHCTKEVCSIANQFGSLQQHNIVVLGISYNDAKTNKNFATKQHVSFPLLNDYPEKKITKLYGVSGWQFPDRVTFLVDERGVIVKIIRDVDVQSHAQQIAQGFGVH